MRRKRRSMALASIILVALIAMVVAWVGRGGGTESSRPGPEVAVVRVGDGDSVTLSLDGSTASCRLIGIDCPELGQEGWGRRALRHTEHLISDGGGVLRVERDVEKSDKYGRALVYLFLADGTMLNERILRDGYAYLLTIPPNVRYVDRFRKAQRRARSERRGIWGSDGPSQSPRSYRRSHPRHGGRRTR